MTSRQKHKPCIRCGKPVVRRYADGSVALNISSQLKAIDPRGFFCTLSCAAQFGVNAAESTLAGGNPRG